MEPLNQQGLKGQQGLECRALSLMLKSHCRHHHGQERLCVGCLELQSFIERKLPDCSSGVNKTPCQHCHSSCLPSAMQAKLIKLGRDQLSPLFLRHPILAWRYWRLLRRKVSVTSAEPRSAVRV